MKFQRTLLLATVNLLAFSVTEAVNFADSFSNGIIDTSAFTINNSSEVSISESSGKLRFDGSIPAGFGDTSNASLNFSSALDSAPGDFWDVQLTATIDTSLTLGPNEVAGVSISGFFNNGLGSSFELGFYRANLGGGTATYIRFGTDDGVGGDTQQFEDGTGLFSFTDSEVFLQLSFNADSDTLLASYGDSAHGEESFSVFSPLADFGGPLNSAEISIDLVAGAIDEGGSDVTDAVTTISGSNFFADDFSVVPEPSAYALLSSLFVSVLVALRRSRIHRV